MSNRQKEGWWGDPIASGFASRASDATDIAALQEFVEEAMVSSVLGVVKSGKEATVYRCAGGPAIGRELLAVKVYHEAVHRSFARSAVYEQGRYIGSRTARQAIAKRTGLGRQLQLQFWVEREFEVLSALGYAGCDVPEVFACTERAILMEFIGHKDEGAPLLQHAELGSREAEQVVERVLWNVETLLRNNVVHADLSPFNILYHAGRPVIIDFPQAVDPRTNPKWRQLLEHDVANVVRFFGRFGIEDRAEAIVGRLARGYTYNWQ